MFDGAGAEGGASNASDGGDSGSPSEPSVVYGKAEEGANEGHVGDDDDEGNVNNPDEEFERLITGDYKEQFDRRVQGILHKRFGRAQESQDRINEYEAATELLRAKYGLKAGDIQGLKKAIENDDGFFSGSAEEQGQTTEAYKENLRLRIDAERGRTMAEEFARQQEKQATFARWDSEAEELKEAFPSFNLTQELDNEIFLDALNRGNDVRTSFFIAHMDEILSGSIQQAQESAQKKTVEAIRRQANRPQENSASTRAAVIRKDDPSKLTDDDLFAIAERARRGEKITF